MYLLSHIPEKWYGYRRSQKNHQRQFSNHSIINVCYPCAIDPQSIQPYTQTGLHCHNTSIIWHSHCLLYRLGDLNPAAYSSTDASIQQLTDPCIHPTIDLPVQPILPQFIIHFCKHPCTLLIHPTVMHAYRYMSISVNLVNSPLQLKERGNTADRLKEQKGTVKKMLFIWHIHELLNLAKSSDCFLIKWTWQ